MGSMWDIFKSEDTLLEEKKARIGNVKQVVDEADPAIEKYLAKWGDKADPAIRKQWQQIKSQAQYKHDIYYPKPINKTSPLEPEEIPSAGARLMDQSKTLPIKPQPPVAEGGNKLVPSVTSVLGKAVPVGGSVFKERPPTESKPIPAPSKDRSGAGGEYDEANAILDPLSTGMNKAGSIVTGAMKMTGPTISFIDNAIQMEKLRTGRGADFERPKIADIVDKLAKKGALPIDKWIDETFPEYFSPSSDPSSIKGVGSAGQYLYTTIAENGPQMLAFYLTSLANPAAGVAAMYAAEGGDLLDGMNQYEKQTGKKIPQELKDSLPVMVGGINAALEKLGLDTMIRATKVPGLRAKLVHGIISSLVEGDQEGLQEIVSILGESDYHKEAGYLLEQIKSGRIDKATMAGMVIAGTTQAGAMGTGAARGERWTGPPKGWKPGAKDISPLGSSDPTLNFAGMKPIPRDEQEPDAAPSVGSEPQPESAPQEPVGDMLKRMAASLREAIEAKKEKEKPVEPKTEEVLPAPPEAVSPVRKEEEPPVVPEEKPAEKPPLQPRIDAALNRAKEKRKASLKPKSPAKEKAHSLAQVIIRRGKINPDNAADHGYNAKNYPKLKRLMARKGKGLGLDVLADEMIADGTIPAPTSDMSPSNWLWEFLNGNQKFGELDIPKNIVELEEEHARRVHGDEAVDAESERFKNAPPQKGAREDLEEKLGKKLPDPQSYKPGKLEAALGDLVKKAKTKFKDFKESARDASGTDLQSGDIVAAGDDVYEVLADDDQIPGHFTLMKDGEIVQADPFDQYKVVGRRGKTGEKEVIENEPKEKGREEVLTEPAPEGTTKKEHEKDPWEMPFDEFYQKKQTGTSENMFDKAKEQHRMSVRTALYSNKDVPGEVLKDYPDLAKDREAEKTQKPEYTAEDIELKPDKMKAVKEIAIEVNGRIYSARQGFGGVYNHGDLNMLYAPNEKPDDVVGGFIDDKGQFVDNKLDPVYSAEQTAEKKVETDAAEVQRLKNSIAEGEMILKSGKKTNGEPYTKEGLESIRRSVNKAMGRLGIQTKAPIAEKAIPVEEPIKTRDESTAAGAQITPTELRPQAEIPKGKIKTKGREAPVETIEGGLFGTEQPRQEDIFQQAVENDLGDAIIGAEPDDVEVDGLMWRRVKTDAGIQYKNGKQLLTVGQVSMKKGGSGWARKLTALHKKGLTEIAGYVVPQEMARRIPPELQNYNEGTVVERSIKGRKVQTWFDGEIAKLPEEKQIRLGYNPTALTEEDNITPPYTPPPPGSNFDMGGYSDTGPYRPNYSPSVVKLPELVRLAREITGKFPMIKQWFRSKGVKGKFISSDIEGVIEILGELAKGHLVAEIPFDSKGKFNRQEVLDEIAQQLGLDPDELIITFEYDKRRKKWVAKIFKPDPTLIAKVLAHEIGHAVDWSPDKSIARGNILGRIASLNKYMKHTLKEYEGSQETEITDADRRRLRKEARRLLSGIKIIEIDTEIRKELKVTPEDILAIWNTFNAREPDPDLYRFMAKLSTEQKKKALIDAVKGIVSDWIDFKRIVIEHKIEKRSIVGKARNEEVMKKYHEMLREEIKKRRLFELETIIKELKKITQIWKPFPEDQDPKYTEYRYASEELYADAVSVLLNDPGLLDAHAPTFKTAFFNYIEKKPEFKATYEDIIRLMTDPDALFESRFTDVNVGFDEMNQIRKDAFTAEEETSVGRDLRKWLIDFREDLLKKKRGVLARGEKVDPEEDPEYWTSELPYIQSQIFQYYRDMGNDVGAMLKEAGIHEGDLGFHLMLRRTATERKYFANPWGYNEEESKGDLQRHFKKLGPEKAAALQKAVDAFYHIRDTKVMPLLRESGMLSAELEEYIENHDNYVTFMVAKYLKEKLGDEQTAIVYKELNVTSAKTYRQYGTFEAIENPFYSTLLKDAALMRAAVRTMAARSVAAFQAKNFPDEIKPIPKTWDGKLDLHKPPPGMKALIWMSKGKASGVYLPKGIVDIFEYRFNDFKGAIKVWNNVVGIFKDIFVGKNVPWSLWNMRRDFRKTLLELPADAKVGKWELFKTMIGSFKDAYLDVFKNFSTDIVRRMYESRALIVGRNWRATVEDEETVFDYILKLNGMDDNHYKNVVINAVRKMWNALEMPGKFSERVMKITGAKILEQRGITGKRAGHLTRSRIGSPDFYRRGAGYGIYNSVFMFSNAGKEGWRSAYEAAKESPSAFFYKLALYDIMPKMAMRAAELGVFAYMAATMFGPDDWRTRMLRKQQELMRKIPNRDKMNYLTCPIGETKNGKAIYICLPHDFTAQVIAGIAWQMSKGFSDKEIASLFDYIQGGIPYSGVAPPIQIVMDSATMLSGKNPYDAFGGRYLIDETRFKASPPTRWKEFFKQEWNRFGGGYIYRFPYDDIDKIQSTLEGALAFPLTGQLLRRAVRVSDRGKYEEVMNEILPDRELRYDSSIELNKKISQHLNQKGVEPSKDDAQKLYNKLEGEGVDVRRFSDFYRRYKNKMSYKENDALASLLGNAQTNKEKVKVYNKYFNFEISEKDLKTAEEYATLYRMNRRGQLSDKDSFKLKSLEKKLKKGQ